MSVKDIRKYFSKFYLTTQNIVLFRLNGILTSTATILQSETMDHLRVRYGNWYNLQLMRRFIECDFYLKNKHVVIQLENMETLGRIVIANTYYKGMNREAVRLYLTNTITIYMPATSANIQINILDDHHAKIILPL